MSTRTVRVGFMAALAACADADPPPLAEQPFEDVFRKVGEVRLQEDPSDPIGLVADIAVVDTLLFVADGFAANVKVFDVRDGRLLATAGAPGDGPGELRSPISVEAWGDTLAVLDDVQQRLSVFNASGELLESRSVPPGRPQRLFLADGRLGITGLFGDSLNAVVDADGNGSGASGRTRLTGGFYERNSVRVCAARLGDRLLIAQRQAGTLDVVPAGTDMVIETWRLVPEKTWPERGTPVNAITEWANSQDWLECVMRIEGEGARWIARASHADADSRTMSYTLGSLDDGPLLRTTRTSAKIGALSGAIAYAVKTDPVGNRTLVTYALRTAWFD